MIAAEKRRTPGGDGGSESSTHRGGSRRQHQHNRFSGCSNGIPGSAYGRAAIASAIDAILFAPPGFRHHETFRQAAAMGELVAGGELRDENRVAAALIGAGRNLGLANRDAERTILNGLKRGKTSPRRAPEGPGLRDKFDALEEIESWWASVMAAEWRGRQGATALKILCGLRDIAMTARKIRVEASYRQMSEAAGVGFSTVAKYRPLIARFARVVEQGSRFTGQATSWQLISRSVANVNRPETYPSGEGGLFTNATSFGGWHQWPTGWRVFSLLEEARTIPEIVAITGLHRVTVSRILKRLAALNYVEHLGREWRATGVDLSDLGDMRSAERRAMHQRHRARWREGLALREDRLAAGGER